MRTFKFVLLNFLGGLSAPINHLLAKVVSNPLLKQYTPPASFRNNYKKVFIYSAVFSKATRGPYFIRATHGQKEFLEKPQNYFILIFLITYKKIP